MKTEHASVCPLDCPDTCSLTVTVEDTRIVNIRGSKANPYTEGVICAKVPAAFPEFVHGPRRIRTPRLVYKQVIGFGRRDIAQ